MGKPTRSQPRKCPQYVHKFCAFVQNKNQGKGSQRMYTCIHKYIYICIQTQRHTYVFTHTTIRIRTWIAKHQIETRFKKYIADSTENRCQGWPSVFCVSLKFHSIKLSPFFTWANWVTSFTTWHIETKCLSHHVHPYVTGSIVVEICTSLHKSSEHWISAKYISHFPWKSWVWSCRRIQNCSIDLWLKSAHSHRLRRWSRKLWSAGEIHNM